MRETPLYQGNQYREANRPQANLPHLSAPDNAMARVLPQAAAAVERAFDKYADLKDYQQQLEKARERKVNEAAFKADLKRRAELPWGSTDSVYLADGSINRDAVQSLVVQYQEKNLATRGNYWKRENNLRDEQGLKLANEMVSIDAFEMLGAQERSNMMRVFNDTFDLMDAQGDVPGAFATADSAVARGLITPQRGEAMKLGIAKRAVEAKAQAEKKLNVGGVDFGGYDAMLAAAVAHDEGVQEEGEAALRPSDLGEFSLSEEGGTFGGEATGLFPDDVVTDGTDDGLEPVEVTDGSQAYTVSAAGRWAAGDDGWAVRSMTGSEYARTQSALRPMASVMKELRDNGRVSFKAAPESDDVVISAVGVANKQNELPRDESAKAIAHIVLGAIAENPKATTDEIYKLVEGSEFVLSMGNGNAQQGEYFTKAVIELFRERAQVSQGRLTTPQMKAMVDAKLASWPAKNYTEAGMIAKLDPTKKLNSDGEYEKPKREKDAKGYEDWHKLFNFYKQYRDEFNPQHPKGDAHKEEFEKIAPHFWTWFMGRHYNQKIGQTKEVAKNYLMGQIGMELANASAGVDPSSGVLLFKQDKDGKSYADEIALVKSVLSRPLPDDMGMDAVEAAERKRAAAGARIAEKFRHDAIPYFEKLRKESEAKAAEKEAAAVQKDAQKAELEKAKEQLQAAAQPRLLQWGWNRVNTSGVDGVAPSCTLPADQYNALFAEYGVDPRKHRVFLTVNGKNVWVEGKNDKGIVELNTPAVLLVTGKPKKGQDVRYKGIMHASYTIK